MANRGFFYDRLVITAVAFPSKAQFFFPFTATHLIIAGRNLKNQEILEFSFNGVDMDGELFAVDSPLAMDGISKNRLWFLTSETQNQGAEIRVWAWHRGGN